MNDAARLGRITGSAAVWLLLAMVCVLSTQAKLSQYHSSDCPTRHLTKTKMSECRLEWSDAVESQEAAPLEAQAAPAEEAPPAVESPRPRILSFLLPWHFRAPPAGPRFILT